MVPELAAALIKSITALPNPFLTYKEFGQQFGFSADFPLAWANKNTLDQVADLLKANPEVRLDLTFLIRNKDTGYPSQIDGQRYREGDAGQQARAREVAAEIIRKYGLACHNPY